MSSGWRLERARRRGGRVAWVLRGPKATERRAVQLGVIAEPDARAALAAFDAFTDEQRGAWLTWYERDQAGAVRGLRGADPAAATDAHARDWPAMRLADYYAEVYAPWRSGTALGWEQERSTWPRILRELGTVRLRDLDAWRVADYLDGMRVERPGLRQGMPSAGATKRLHRAAILALLRRAHRLRHLETVPDLATFRLRGSSKGLPKKPPLTRAELDRLLVACSPKLAAMVGLCAGIGLRPSECSRVRWEDFTWIEPAGSEGSGFAIEPADGAILQIRGRKTEASSAAIPLTALAFAPVSRWWRACGCPSKGPAFPSMHGGEAGAYGVQGWRKQLERAAERAELGRPVTPYLLRHTFATLCWSAGIPQDVAVRMMRHTSSKMLDEVYARPGPDDLAARLRGRL